MLCVAHRSLSRAAAVAKTRVPSRACSSSTPPAPPSKTVCFGAGAAGGGFGSLVGIGGGAVMVPIMTSFANMTQHQAVGTSSAAVAGTGLAAAASFGSAGAVDFYAAAALASTAMLTARLGARFTSRFNPVQLQVRARYAFAYFHAPSSKQLSQKSSPLRLFHSLLAAAILCALSDCCRAHGAAQGRARAEQQVDASCRRRALRRGESRG